MKAEYSTLMFINCSDEATQTVRKTSLQEKHKQSQCVLGCQFLGHSKDLSKPTASAATTRKEAKGTSTISHQILRKTQ